MKQAEFTGYINLAGHHVKDGLKTRPVAFQEDGDEVVLRWIKPTSDGKFYEHEERAKKADVLSGAKRFDLMKTGIEALNQLQAWVLKRDE